MFILIGIFSLIVMVIVGCVRTKKRLKSQDEFAHNAVIKWALAGWSSFLIFIYLEASNNPDGNNTILLIVSICSKLVNISWFLLFNAFVL